MVKKCSKCKVEKPFDEFGKRKSAKYGLRSQCKSCEKEYREANKERLNEYKKEYRQKNKERIKEWYQKNKEYKKQYQKEYNQKNKERIKEYKKEYNKEYNQKNKENRNEYNKEWYQKNKEYKNEYYKQRRKTDPLFKLKCNLRARTSMGFKNKGYSKNTKTQEMLGVDWEVCKAHIERQFTKGMNWDNQGEWHIDHIIPLASAKTPERLKKLCHYTNLQPMWAEENLSKKDSINGQQTLLRI